MRVNAASLDIRDATTSTPGTLNDLTTDLIMANNNNTKFCLCCHSLQRVTFAGKSAGLTELMKHSLLTGTWPCREWAAFVSCLIFSTIPHPLKQVVLRHLLVSRHPVIDQYAFSSGSSLEACGDLAQAGHVYSAAE